MKIKVTTRGETEFGADPERAEPQIRAAMLDANSAARAFIAEILAEFDPGKGDGYRARVGQVKYAGWKRRAGIEAGQ